MNNIIPDQQQSDRETVEHNVEQTFEMGRELGRQEGRRAGLRRHEPVPIPELPGEPEMSVEPERVRAVVSYPQPDGLPVRGMLVHVEEDEIRAKLEGVDSGAMCARSGAVVLLLNLDGEEIDLVKLERGFDTSPIETLRQAHDALRVAIRAWEAATLGD